MFPLCLPNQIGSVVLVASLAGALSGSESAAQAPPTKPTSPSATEKPSPSPKTLTGEDAKRVETLEKAVNQLRRAGKFMEAIEPAKQVQAICEKALGPDHWQTADAGWTIETLRATASLPEAGRQAMASVGALEEEADALENRAKYVDAEKNRREVMEKVRRWLGEGHPDTARGYNNLAANLDAQGQYGDAQPLYQRALDIRRKALGEGHPDTAASYNNLALNLYTQGRYGDAQPLYQRALDIWRKALGEGHPATATSYNNLALNLYAQGRYGDAQPLYQRALDICRKALGEDHSDTARGYNNLAVNLDAQGRYGDAQPLLQRALDIRRKALGEGHPHTACCYNNLAMNLYAQGRYGDAQPFHQRALDICRKALGEGHPDTASSYNSLALNLDAQGRYGDAQPLFQRALDIRRKALGEGHPHTASSYNSLAFNLDAQGRYGDAQPFYQRALDICRKALGEGHPDTASSYNDLAGNLEAQGRYGDAQPLYQRALDIWCKALGEGHPHTATSYNNLALNLYAQGRYGDAQPLYQRALDITRKALGEGHPHTATSYNNLALNLYAQGRYGDAQPLLQRALDIRRKALGEGHPHTATSYNNLAANLDAQGRLQEAVAHWKAAAESIERGRRAVSSSGLERAQATRIDPLSALALASARQDQDRDAWQYWESNLARGLLDDLSARQLRPLASEERRQEADLLGQLQRLDEQIGKLAAQSRRTQDDDRRLEQLRNEEGSLRGRFLELEQALEARYGAFAGKPATLEEIQAAIPADAALVGWVDLRPGGSRPSYHWACVVRKHGDPAWVKIPGSGKGGDWTKEDDRPIETLRNALAQNLPTWPGLAAQVARQRLEPLLPHLKGIKRLIVLPSQDLAGLPVESLVAAGPPEISKLVVSYAPSGTMFARLIRPRPGDSGPARLLALGDPAYPEPEPQTPLPKPPDHGIAILLVQPHGPADLAGIQRDDVLLEYDGTVLKSYADLKVIPAEAGPKRIPVKLWRNGDVRALEVSAGKLGINLDRQEPAAEVVLAQREADKMLKPLTRGQDWDRLPGTRREVEAIAGLFTKGQATTLFGPRATESAMQRLAGAGELKNYRYLHFAAHGKTNPAVAMSSAIILAPDPDRSANPTAAEADGQVTAQQIVNTWELDADLVVLSACVSGLGRYAGGEGYLGFSQALFVKGARSLLLSLWEVHDQSTALLMQRFYQNLLGARPGLSRPLPKAEALAETKAWLRGLDEKEAAQLIGALPAPVRGGKTTHRQPPRPKPPPRPEGRHPDAHPYYWAAFILVGDPN